MKKYFAIFLAISVALLCVIGASANNDIKVIINGVEIGFDVPPQIIGDRTMVPMRAVFEALGAKVEWVADMRLVLATHGTCIITMPVDAYSFTVTEVISGETKELMLDVPAQIVNDRTLIPLRAVSEALGKTVEWDSSTRTATITG